MSRKRSRPHRNADDQTPLLAEIERQADERERRERREAHTARTTKADPRADRDPPVSHYRTVAALLGVAADELLRALRHAGHHATSCDVVSAAAALARARQKEG